MSKDIMGLWKALDLPEPKRIGEKAKYRIMGSYRGGREEELDTITGLREASRMAQEYRMAFGAGWEIRKEQIK